MAFIQTGNFTAVEGIFSQNGMTHRAQFIENVISNLRNLKCNFEEHYGKFC